MPVDPLTSLAFSMYSSPGVFAFLLGSGLSRSAGIPTGYEVLIDLIEKIAKINGVATGGNAEGWFYQTYSEKATYSRLLEQLAHSPAERSRLLRNYFEPNEDERSQGLKLPTPAHRAIAGLVKDGYVRVIVTTNFDRLMEQALDGFGLVPVVVSTEESARGVTPLAHNTCTIIKVNGDYLDPDLRNTDEELANYGPHLTQLISEVFEDYGLSVCGWSAEWDSGLIASLKGTLSRRFSTYWCVRGGITEAARDLNAFRRGTTIEIANADSFFTALSEKVTALQDLGAADPVSIPIAVATVKRYLPDPQQVIRLSDFVIQETRRTRTELDSLGFSMSVFDRPVEIMDARLQQYESKTELLRHIVSVGAYWGTSEQAHLWANAVRSLSNLTLDLSNPHNGALVRLTHYPATLVFYAAGVAALAGGRFGTLARMFETRVEKRSGNNEEDVCTSVLHPLNVIDTSIARGIPTLRDNRTPGSNRVFDAVRGALADIVEADKDYDRLFDDFECLVSLHYIDVVHAKGKNFSWAPVGRFACKWSDDGALTRITSELGSKKDDWPPLRGGLFGGDCARAKTAVEEFAKFLDANAADLRF
jgi:hypothetical protein